MPQADNSVTMEDRYHRQMLLQGIGEAGQSRIRASHALIVGCGALGTMIADTLTRAGIGTLTIVDRDVVELTNLQRQVLFDENDLRDGRPKAIAAQRKLNMINSDVEVIAHVDDFNHTNAERISNAADLILDGLDNFETRYVLNDLAVSKGVPYVYGGAVGMTGMTMTVMPHPMHRCDAPNTSIAWPAVQSTPCLRCVFPDAPPAGTGMTCDTVGVLAPVVSIIAAWQCTQAIKLMTGHVDSIDRSLLSINVWSNAWRSFEVSTARIESCPCCGQGNFEWLVGSATSAATSLCGRNAVQVLPSGGHQGGETPIDLSALRARLSAHGEFESNNMLLRGTLTTEHGPQGDPIELTLFANGRAIIKGTSEPELARSIYARYVGS